MNENSKVMVKSGVKGRVGVSLPELRFKRQWPKMGAMVPMEFSILQEAIFNDGFSRMLKNGVLVIEDMEAKIALGLEPEGATEPVNTFSLNEMQMVKLLKVDPIDSFKETISKLSKDQLMSLCDIAIEKEIYDFEKTDLLKKKTNIDIRKAIELNRKDKEEVITDENMPKFNSQATPPPFMK